MKKYPAKSWPEIVTKAHEETINLSATGFYGTTDYSYDWNTNTGTPHIYFTYGASVSEVEIDCLTGDHQVLKTDIVMDVGRFLLSTKRKDLMLFLNFFTGESLNPAIDIGQIEGGFMQGYGLFVLEEMVFLNNGAIFTRGPGTYKIPSFNDIPLEFNVALLKSSSNARAIYSSKVTIFVQYKDLELLQVKSSTILGNW